MMWARRILRAANYVDEINLIVAEASKTRIDGVLERGFRINDVVIAEPRMIALPKHSFVLKTPDYEQVLKVIHPTPEILIVGTSKFKPNFLDKTLVERMRAQGTSVEAMDLKNACATFNILNEEDRLVVAVLMHED